MPNKTVHKYGDISAGNQRNVFKLCCQIFIYTSFQTAHVFTVTLYILATVLFLPTKPLKSLYHGSQNHRIISPSHLMNILLHP